MGRQVRLRRVDWAVTFGCVVLALMTLGAVGQSGRGRAMEAVCLFNAHQLSRAWLLFAEEHDGRLIGGHPGDNPTQWVGRPVLLGSVEQKLDVIRRGLLFPYLGDVRVYRCPANERQSQPNQFDLRSFSIAGGANGEDWLGYVKARKYSDLTNPAGRYVFVEDCGPRGADLSSWLMNLKHKSWVDPIGMWHDDKSTLGFADGHAETHRWHDRSFIAWNLIAMRTPSLFALSLTPPAEEREDIEYMAGGFPYKALR